MAASTFQPQNPRYAERARTSLARQGAMRLIGAPFDTLTPGRTPFITRGEVHAVRAGQRTLVARMQQTQMVMHGKPGR